MVYRGPNRFVILIELLSLYLVLENYEYIVDLVGKIISLSFEVRNLFNIDKSRFKEGTNMILILPSEYIYILYISRKVDIL